VSGIAFAAMGETGKRRRSGCCWFQGSPYCSHAHARLANFQSSKATEPNLKFCTTTPLIIAYDKLKKK
jgi:hypothetical protein